MKYYGWSGTLLRVDLTKKEVIKEPIPEDLAIDFLGGEGFGAKLLYDEVPPETDPLDPEMIFVIGVGPLSGTRAPSCGRVELISKSALTGIFGDSNAGGSFGPTIHRAGYDAIVLRGKAERPVYIWIDDDKVEIRNASHLWGKDIYESISIVKKEIGDAAIETLSIGPAGENKVAFASVMVGRDRAAGKGCLGAVLGAKNLKMIAARGTKGIEIAQPDEFEEVAEEIREGIKSSPIYPIMLDAGTLRLVDSIGKEGSLPIRNFQEGWLPPGKYKKVKFDSLKKLRVSKSGCFRCPLACSNDLLIKEGLYAGTVKEPVKIEYGCVLGCGTMIGCLDSSFIVKCSDECNRLGLDVMNTMFSIAWAMELYQRHIITREEVDGLELTWGNQAVVLDLLQKIAYRRGFGDILGDGHDKAAEKIGRESRRYQCTINGNCTETDCRSRYGIALAFAISTRGGDHLKGLPVWEFPTESAKGKDDLVMAVEKTLTLMDCLGLCKFASCQRLGYGYGYDEENLGRLLTAATGVEYNERRLAEVAERIRRLEIVYNAREGLRRKDFKLPERFYKDPIPAGPLKGAVMDERILDTLINSYFTKHGVDPETAIPKRKGLEEVGLKYVADDLQARGLI